MADSSSASGDKSNAMNQRAPLRWAVRALQTVTGPWTWRNLLGWVVVVSAILVVKGCLVDQYTIPSGSMEPTLHGDPRFFRGDRVLVNKLLFGPRIPFTTRRLVRWAEPRRWDIVVFRAVDPDAEHPILIKRVIGLPGERIHIADGRIHVNGEAVEPPEPLRETLRYTTRLEISDIERRRQLLRLAQVNQPLPMLNPNHPPVKTLYAEMERLHERVNTLDVDALTDGEVETLCTETPHAALHLIHNIYEFAQPDMFYGVNEDPRFSVVPENHYFLLGDNSAQSLDGRMYGWAPHNHLYGRAFAVWWPWSHRQDLTGFSSTWWGAALLYGIPALLVIVEITAAVRKRRRPE